MKADLGQLNSNFSLTNLYSEALLFVRYLTDAAVKISKNLRLLYSQVLICIHVNI